MMAYIPLRESCANIIREQNGVVLSLMFRVLRTFEFCSKYIRVR